MTALLVVRAMRTLHIALASFILLAGASKAAAQPYQGSRFDDVWAQVASDPYAQLPHETVSVSKMFTGWVNHMLADSKRTLADGRDLLPRFDKLLHPNGMCLKGVWRITEPTPYTGQFATGSQSLFIGRASTALTETRAGHYRAFGLAGKLFPTMDPTERVQTANFFTIEDLGGTLTDHFLDAGNTNDIIHITVRLSSVFNGVLALVVANAFMQADQTFDVTQTLIRQLYPISTIGLGSPASARTPTWMMITGAADVPRVDEVDFRDELRMSNYPGGLAFEIWLADRGTRLGEKAWKRAGRIDITATVASDSCDHRLHFRHPRHRPHQP